MENIFRRRCATCANVRGSLVRLESFYIDRYGKNEKAINYETGLVCQVPEGIIYIDKAIDIPRGRRVEKTFVCPLWQAKFTRRP